MIEQTGLVVALQGDYALVESARETACGGCAANADCGTSVLARVFSSRPVSLRVVNPVHAQVGDRVVIGISAGSLLRGSLALYMAPLAGLFAGALAGGWSGPVLFASGSELFAVAGAACGFVAGLAWLRGFSRSTMNRNDYQPVILRQVLPVSGP